MKTRNSVTTAATSLLAAAFLAPALFAADATTNDAKTAAPDMNDPAMMAKMMELAKTNENHKLLAQLVGTWDVTSTMWMAPGAPPTKTTGTAVRKGIMDDRYFVVNFSGPMEMPGADGKPQKFDFKGMSIEGYDNVKQRFVSTWCDNMGTGILMSEGTYDPATKSFTYHTEMEMVPGMKTKVREVVKVVDADHHVFEWYEDRRGQETKTMEINYTRKK